MKKEEIIERINKLRKLADQGVGGEKFNAQARIEEIMQKYGITDSDLEKEELKFYYYAYKNSYEDQLFRQICAVVNRSREAGIIRRDIPKRDQRILKQAFGFVPTCRVECTKAEIIEIESMFDVYKASFEAQLDTFLYAFIMKNNLLVDADPDCKSTLEERQRAFMASQMAAGIDKVQYHRAIGYGKS